MTSLSTGDPAAQLALVMKAVGVGAYVTAIASGKTVTTAEAAGRLITAYVPLYASLFDGDLDAALDAPRGGQS